jgi:protein-S-isoprenylcysteine O-methyltransferase Ste14
MASFHLPVHVPPPLWALVAGLVQRRLPAGRPPGVLTKAAAGAVLVGSAALVVTAGGRFRDAGTTVDPVHPERVTHLVTDGPYALTRNPMYVSMAGVLVAHAVWRRSVAALLPVAAFVAVIDRLQVPGEEAALGDHFGSAYDDYRARVPRWVGLRPMSRPSREVTARRRP